MSGINPKIEHVLKANSITARLLNCLLFGFVVFLLLLALWHQPVFTSDEPEIFIKGQQIVRGGLLYRDVDSQHMPLMYHIAAGIALLGVSSFTGFRTAFYSIYAFLYMLIFARYQRYLSKKAISLYILTYLFVLPTISYGTAVLSEQFQGIGMAILLFELLIYHQKRKIDLWACLYCALAVFISFGSAFVSAFGIAIFFLGLLLFSFEHSNSFRDGVVRCCRSILPVAITCVAPFICYSLYFFHTRTVRDWFRWAYRFNVEVYSKYLFENQGYGNSIPGAFLGGISHIAEAFRITGITSVSVIHCAVVILFILFLLEKWHESRLLAVIIVLFTVACATRDGFAFHGIPMVAVLSALIGYELSVHATAIHRWVAGGRYLNRQLLVIVLVLIISSSYLSEFKDLFYYTHEEIFDTSSEEYALNVLGEAFEEVGYFNVNHELLIRGKKLPANLTWGVCPWFWEWEKEQILNELNSKMPRIFCYSPNQSVWGYSVSQFAPEISSFLTDYYVCLNSIGYPGLYIRKDYYYSAVSKLVRGKLFSSNRSSGNTGPLLQGMSITQPFISYEDSIINRIDICMGTYGRINSCNVVVSICNEETGEVTELAQKNSKDFVDNTFIGFETARYEVKCGGEYSIIITCPDAQDNDAITVYYGERAMLEDYKSKVNDMVVPNTLAMVIHCVDTDYIPVIKLSH